jgi:hypothetical protein
MAGAIARRRKRENYMGWARELTEHEEEFCRALGEVVVFWNHVEQSFRILLQRATFLGGPDGRLWSLIAQLTPVQLKDAMIAISPDHAPERGEHLKHCAALFDREREYRNHYVHGPLTFLTTEQASEALVAGVVARGGSLRVHQAKVSAAELTGFRNRLGALQSYIGELLQDSRNLRDGKPLTELEMPPIAPRLVLSKTDWWDAHGGDPS